MVFSSFLFLFGFLPVFLLCYALSPRPLKNITALLGSYFFYAWGAPKIVPILLLSSCFDYALSLKFAGKRGKILFSLTIAANLCLLGYFKYSNFFVAQINAVFEQLLGGGVAWTAVVLPIGISFFTFQKISYLADVYTGRAKPARSVFDYLLYVALFPQLIAGPIIRYYDIDNQIRSRDHSIDKIWSGVLRFSVGLGKKVLIADEVGKTVDIIFGIDPSILPSHYALLGVLAYAMQIYFDFSGYSDMAIGLGRIMGFEFIENFNMPYISQSITEFWRRWHISLSNWMRDYLYIPLGGNRCGKLRTYANLWIVFLLSGLWHGASWTFIVWGVFHGFFLVFDKLIWLKVAARLPRVINVGLTFSILLISWVLFRSESFSESYAYLNALCSFSTFGDALPSYYLAGIMHFRGRCMLVAALLLSFAPLFFNKQIGGFRQWCDTNPRLCLGLEFILAAVALVFSILVIASGSFSPFLYFRF